MLPMYVAMDQGFYKSGGLDFEIKTVGGDQNGIRALITGVGQVTVVGAPILYEAVTNGAKVIDVGLFALFPAFLLTRILFKTVG